MCFLLKFFFIIIKKTRRGGPVDNRPSPNKLQHFVKRKEKKKKSDNWHLTPDTWHLTPDTWHMTHDMWHMVGGNILSKVQLPSSYGLG